VARRRSNEPRREPTIRDVAAQARVSVATVSAVLNGSRPVRAALRARVEDAIQALGYRPNLIARALNTRRSHTLALLVPSLTNPMFVRLAEIVEGAAHTAGYALFVAVSQGRPERAREQVERLITLGVDGLLAVLSWDIVEGLPRQRMERHGVPVVGVGGSRTISNVDCLVTDDEQAGRVAGRYLAALGHKAVWFIGVTGSQATELRARGLQDSLSSDAGSDSHLWITYANGHGELDGAQAIETMLKEGTDASAVVALNDAMAVGALNALRAAGIRVPDCISVIGFGDTVSSFSFPKLSTLAYPVEDIGRASVQRILARINGDDAPAQIRWFSAQLIIRASTGHPGSSRHPHQP
jgi:LacI family transcriptional regulator